MSNKGTFLTDDLYAYLQKVSIRTNPILQELRETTMVLPKNIMQIAPEQGQFMQLLIKLMGAKRTIEVGVFTGYSALAVALALPEDGEIIACDISQEWTDIAKKYWKNANVLHKIKLKIAPAADTLQELIDAGESGTFDFAFIDADKGGYEGYYEQCLTLIKSGGLIMLDNMLMHAGVLNPGKDDSSAAIYAMNQILLRDERVDISLLPLADGVTLARKR